MRASRALLGSLGAGLSLAVAASVVLLVVSSVVAFRGWPAGVGHVVSSTSSIEQPARSQRAAQRAQETGSLALALAPVHTSAHVRHGAAGTRSTQTVAGGDRQGPSGTGHSSPTTVASAPAASSSPQPRTTSAGDAVRQTTSGAATTVTQTTQQVGGAVRPVSPAVADTIDQTGAAVGSTVQGTGDAAAGTVDKLVP